MERFVTRYQDRIAGILSGFDRLVFRGLARSFCYRKGMEIFLARRGVLLKDFGRFAQEVSDRLKAHAEASAAREGRPLEYLPSSQRSKEDRAQQIAARDGLTEGVVCILSCVEPCRRYGIRKDRQTRQLTLQAQERKCLHLYFYYLDRELGLMHVRLQTWLPFTIQICVNGRAWLAHRLMQAGIPFTPADNCFTAIGEVSRAQALLDRLTDRSWSPLLTAWARRVNPWLAPMAGLDLHGYYWTLWESEYATDVMFRDRTGLQAVYPTLVQHAITQFGSDDVLRVLGRRPDPRITAEVTSSLTRRVEGVRVKHRVDENSIKMYDKPGCVLRIEPTINTARRFKVWRLATRKGRRGRAWIPMRKGIADIPRRVEISRAANARYLDALSVVGEPSPSHHLLDPVSVPVIHDGRRHRPLRPISPQELPLLRAGAQGVWLVHGFRNADLCTVLYPNATGDPVHQRRAANRVTRHLRLLRAHGLIQKVSTTRYYRLTPRGHLTLSTALRFRDRDIALLAA